MTNANLLQAMGRIDPKLIADAAPDVTRKKGIKKVWLRGVLLRAELPPTMRRAHPRMRFIAASLALVLCLVGFFFLHKPDSSKVDTFSWFTITAYAADGDLEELKLNDGFFNSGGTGEQLFGVAAPLFRFTVKPANWEESQEVYFGFVITVSYNGKIVDSLNDHVLVAHLIPVPGSDAPYECEIVGWFEEATDIIITISDRETGTLIEEQTVNVCYSPDSQAYQLTVTNIQTHDVEK